MYCSHFGLHRPAFNNTPDPTFYYRTPEHDEALATLQYATRERKGFVLITGEVGAGKTLTGRMFLRDIEDQAVTAVINHTNLSGQQLLASICSEFELDPPPDANKLQLTHLLQDFLLEQFARDRYVVVLIDEAQNLGDEGFEDLRMLGNLEADDAKLLQVCILGQPELRERFAQPAMRQLEQRLFRRFHLAELSRQHVEAYVRHRLAVAGCTDDIFTPDAIEAIHQASHGVPRVINRICDNALLAAYASDRKTVDGRLIEEVVETDAQAQPAPAAEPPVVRHTDEAGITEIKSFIDRVTRNQDGQHESLARDLKDLRAMHDQVRTALDQARESLDSRLKGKTDHADFDGLRVTNHRAHDDLRRHIDSGIADARIEVGHRIHQCEADQKRRLDEISEQHRTDIDALSKSLRTQEDGIRRLGESLDTRLGELSQRLVGVEESRASRESVDRMRDDHERELGRLSSKLADESASLRDLAESIATEFGNAAAGNREEYRSLSERVLKLTRQLRAYRVRMEGHEQRMTDALDALADRYTTREEWEQSRRDQDRRTEQLESRCDHLATRDELDDRASLLEARTAECATREELGETRRELSERSDALASRTETLATREELESARTEQTARMDQIAAQTSRCATREELEERSRQIEARTAECATREELGETRRELSERSDALASRTETLATREELESARTEQTARMDQIAAQTSRCATREELGETRRELSARTDEIITRTEQLATHEELETARRAQQESADRIEVALAEKSEIRDFDAFRAEQRQELNNLHGRLDQHRQDVHDRFEQVVADWVRTQERIEALDHRAADAEEVEALRRRLDEGTKHLLESVSVQRRELETLIDDVDMRCNQVRERFNALPEDLVDARELESLRADCSGQITRLSGELDARRRRFEQAIRAVVRRLSKTLEMVNALGDRCGSLSGGIERLEASSATRQELESAERILNRELYLLSERFNAFASRQAQNLNTIESQMQEATRRIEALETREVIKPLQVSLTPTETAQLGTLVQAARTEQDDLARRLAAIGRARDELKESEARFQTLMEEWREHAGSVGSQSEQLRHSARLASGILAKMQSCNEALDAKLDSEQWQSEVARGERVAARLEQAVHGARAVCRELARRINEIRGEQKRFDEKLDHRRHLLNEIAQNTSGLARLIETAREEDERRRPSPTPESAPPAAEKPRAVDPRAVRWPSFRTHRARLVGSSG